MEASLNHKTNLLTLEGKTYPIDLDLIYCTRDKTVYTLLKKLGFFRVSQRYIESANCTIYSIQSY